MKKFALLLCVLALLSACGKRGSLEPPPGGERDYPKTYPQY